MVTPALVDDEERACFERERALRCMHAAETVCNFPIVEHALDLYANGGPDMRGEAEALAALLADFSERMRRCPTSR